MEYHFCYAFLNNSKKSTCYDPSGRFKIPKTVKNRQMNFNVIDKIIIPIGWTHENDTLAYNKMESHFQSSS